LMESKDYKEALKNIELSKEWPENLGEGKPYDVDTRIQEYMTGYCLRKLGTSTEAPKITIQTLRDAFQQPRYKEIIDRLQKLERKD
jgi:hypothetical protein